MKKHKNEEIGNRGLGEIIIKIVKRGARQWT